MEGIRILVLLLVTVISIVKCQPPSPTRQYMFQYTLAQDSNKEFFLYWSIDVESNNADYGLVCRGVGGTIMDWCAIGFSYIGNMVGSDAVIGSVSSDPDNQLIFDYQMNAQVPPNQASCPNGVCLDSSPTMPEGCRTSVRNLTSSQVGEYLILEFTKDVTNDDPCDHNVTVDSLDTSILWAMGYGKTPFSCNQHIYYNAVYNFNWYPALTTQVFTTQPITTQGITTNGPNISTIGDMTTQSMTTNSLTSKALTSKPITSSPLTTNAVTPSNIKSSDTLYGINKSVFILIIIGAILIILALVITVAILAKKRNFDREFKGFH